MNISLCPNANSAQQEMNIIYSFTPAEDASHTS